MRSPRSLRPPLFSAMAVMMMITMPTPAFSAELFKREVNEKNPGGKDLKMTFEETSRDGDVSTVKVGFTSGASVASMMFIVKCACEMAKERKMPYFIKLKEWVEKDGSLRLRYGFTKTDREDPVKLFKLSEPVPDTPGSGYLEVKTYEALFEEEDEK